MGIHVEINGLVNGNIDHDVYIELYRSSSGWEIIHIIDKIGGYEDFDYYECDQPQLNDLDSSQVSLVIDAINNHHPPLACSELIIDFLKKCKDGLTVHHSY